MRELLREDRARARRPDSGRPSPLTYAARGGHPEVVRLLLHHGCDPSRPEELAPEGHALWMARAPPEFVTHDGFPTAVPAADFHLTKHLSASATWGGNLRFSFRELEYDCVMQDGEVWQAEDTRHATFECNLESVRVR